VLQQIVFESGSFQMLEPAMQAIVQTAATSVVENQYVRANSVPVLELLPVVPLLTTQSYSLMIQQVLTGGRLFLTCIASKGGCLQ
jgi:hypothetical protein